MKSDATPLVEDQLRKKQLTAVKWERQAGFVRVFATTVPPVRLNWKQKQGRCTNWLPAIEETTLSYDSLTVGNLIMKDRLDSSND